MANDLQVFNNPDFGTLRGMDIDGEAWFVGRDIAGALGYSKVTDAVTRHVDIEDTSFRGILDSNGKTQQTKIINESGVITLILVSELPSAKKFKRWVTKEVLPSILKTGSYTHQSVTPAELSLRLATQAVELERQLAEHDTRIAAAETKLDTAIQTFLTASPENQRGSMERQLGALCRATGSSPAPWLRGQIYADVDSAAGINLNERLRRLQKRMRKNNGMKYEEARVLTKLDIISRDKQLKAVFEGVLKKYQARYCLSGELVLCDDSEEAGAPA